jgi:hypothetical protein
MVDLEFKCVSEKEFVDEIKKSYIDKREAEEDIEHERAHYLMAKKLGYHPNYWLLNNFPMVLLEEDEVKDEDIIQIALAPKNPSIKDKKRARDAEMKIQERRYFLGC